VETHLSEDWCHTHYHWGQSWSNMLWWVRWQFLEMEIT